MPFLGPLKLPKCDKSVEEKRDEPAKRDSDHHRAGLANTNQHGTTPTQTEPEDTTPR